MTVFVDSNVLLRHLTGEPPDQASRAGAALRSGETLVLVDLIVAEVVFVLESVYLVERPRVAELVRAILSFPTISVADAPLLLRALELYEEQRIHFAEAYLAACAEYSGVGRVMSSTASSDASPPSSGSSQAFDRAARSVQTSAPCSPGLMVRVQLPSRRLSGDTMNGTLRPDAVLFGDPSRAPRTQEGLGEAVRLRHGRFPSVREPS